MAIRDINNTPTFFHVVKPVTKTETILPPDTTNISSFPSAVEATEPPTDLPLVYPLRNTKNSSIFKTPSRERSSQNPFVPPMPIRQVGRIDDVLMILDGCTLLTDEAVRLWENVTAKHFTLAMAIAMKTSVSMKSLESIGVAVHFRNQSQANYSFDCTTNERIFGDFGRRKSDQSPVVINFDFVVSLRSSTIDHNLSKYLVLALEYDNDVLDYLGQLQSSSYFAVTCRIKRFAVIMNGVKILPSAFKARRVNPKLSSEFSFLGVALYALFFLLFSLLALIKIGRCWRVMSTKDDLSHLNETGSSYDVKHAPLDVSSISDSIPVVDGRVPWDLSSFRRTIVVRKHRHPSSPTISFAQSDVSFDHSVTELSSLNESSIDYSNV